MTGLLDRNRRYRTKDRTETWWTFVFEKVDNHEGWQAYRRAPKDSFYLGQGFWKESDVHRWLTDHALRMTEDDMIDSIVWLRSGGLEALFTVIGGVSALVRAEER